MSASFTYSYAPTKAEKTKSDERIRCLNSGRCPDHPNEIVEKQYLFKKNKVLYCHICRKLDSIEIEMEQVKLDAMRLDLEKMKKKADNEDIISDLIQKITEVERTCQEAQERALETVQQKSLELDIAREDNESLKKALENIKIKYEQDNFRLQAAAAQQQSKLKNEFAQEKEALKAAVRTEKNIREEAEWARVNANEDKKFRAAIVDATGNKSIESNVEVKVIILGASGVGKTSVVVRYCDDTFSPNPSNTPAMQTIIKKAYLKDAKFCVRYSFTDTVGTEKFDSVPKSYFRNTQVAIFVYDVSVRRTFDCLADWLQKALEHCDNDVILVVVGNKADLERQVTHNEGVEYAVEYNAIYMETSAKDDGNIHNLFGQILIRLQQRAQQEAPSWNVEQSSTSPHKANTERLKALVDLESSSSGHPEPSYCCYSGVRKETRSTTSGSTTRNIDPARDIYTLQFPVYVNMLADNSSIVLHCNSTDTISSVKQQIENKNNISESRQTLLYGGQALKDNEKTLSDYHIGKEVTLHLAIS